MTREQFGDIQDRLSKWREDRGLSIEDQKKNFKVNYTKKLTKFYEAERDCNEHEMIDALCDMIVVAINAGYSLTSSYFVGMSEIDYEVLPLVNNGVGVIELCNCIEYYGRDPYKCLLEKIKELESCTDFWNEKEGKWEKVCNKETLETYWVYNTNDSSEGKWSTPKINKWYKADYSDCKLSD